MTIIEAVPGAHSQEHFAQKAAQLEKYLTPAGANLALADIGRVNLESGDNDWWRQAVVYQIYPRSFCDANGDGIGDLQGITSKIPYLKRLGIDAVWLSPFYPSSLKDGGYDVADYRNVDPRIGTLKDFDMMMRTFKQSGIKVIVDIVPNHSSNEHPWFKQALAADKGSEERARYHFRDGLGPDKQTPPSDWQSIMGGSAWSPTGRGDGQFYLHLYDSSQPDLNWSNAEVRHDFVSTLRFWADRGVSGFRVDVASGCAKDLSEPFEKWDILKARRATMIQPGGSTKGLLHPVFDRDEVLSFWREWRQILAEYNPPLCAVAEAWVAPERKRAYAEALGQVFAFDIMLCNFDVAQYKAVIERQIAAASDARTSTTWVLSNHDVVRHHTRYGLSDIDSTNLLTFLAGFQKYLEHEGRDPVCDAPLGLRRGRAATLMILALPGSTYLFQGEELGLPEVPDIPEDCLQDPYYFRNGKKDKGRDGCRVPLPWLKSGHNFGNGHGAPTHLPQPEWFGGISVQAQESDPHSTLQMYRLALSLRKRLQGPETFEWVDLGKCVLAFKRPGGWLVVLNGGPEDIQLPSGKILIASVDITARTLPPNTAAWLQT